MKQGIEGVTVECVDGDITDQNGFDAVVNAANAALGPGGGVVGAIHQMAGPELDDACRPLAPIQPGQSAITPAFRLPNRYVIHCLGPVYGVDNPSDQVLASCYRGALELAEQHELQSVAFPAISIGAFGYPMADAAVVAMQEIKRTALRLSHINHIRFVLLGLNALTIHERELEKIAGDT